jgi:polyribonucleotide nucleotidyltransferase
LGDFFPLTVEYREKAYAAGKIPGGYFKREAKPSDKEVLTCRIIDRPLRPMFPEGYKREVQIVCSVLSADEKFDADTLAVIGSSAAIGLSTLPFEDQIACVKVIGVNGKYIVNPTYEETETADIELIVAGSATSICMVEGSALEVSEDVMVAAIQAGHEAIKLIVKGQQELISKFEVKKDVFVPKAADEELAKKVEAIAKPMLNKIFHTPMLKKAHYAAMKQVKEDVAAALGEAYKDRRGEINEAVEAIQWSDMREMVLSEKLRIDGRGPADIRDISIETSAMPRTHGSAVFQRGETQALVVCT